MACQRELALVLSPAGGSWEIFSFFKTNVEFLIPIVFSLKLHKCPIHWEGKDKEADQRIQSIGRHLHSYVGSHYSWRWSHEPKLFWGGLFQVQSWMCSQTQVSCAYFHLSFYSQDGQAALHSVVFFYQPCPHLYLFTWWVWEK